VEGCLEWQQIGLQEPHTITKSVEEWKADSDPFAGFFETKCELKPNAKASPTALWEAFKAYAEAADLDANQRQFTDQLKRLGCVAGRTNSERFWSGIQLR
jgi:putative DNA primase/helicase